MNMERVMERVDYLLRSRMHGLDLTIQVEGGKPDAVTLQLPPVFLSRLFISSIPPHPPACLLLLGPLFGLFSLCGGAGVHTDLLPKT